MRYYVLIRPWCATREQYWTGEIKPSGEPRVSWRIGHALVFSTARDAYDTAAKYMKQAPRLGRFKVGSREIA